MVVVAAVVNHYHVVDSMRPLIATTSVGGYNKLLCVFACVGLWYINDTIYIIFIGLSVPIRFEHTRRYIDNGDAVPSRGILVLSLE